MYLRPNNDSNPIRAHECVEVFVCYVFDDMLTFKFQLIEIRIIKNGKTQNEIRAKAIREDIAVLIGKSI